MKKLALVLLLVGCGGEIAVPACDVVGVEIAMPDGCWEDPACELDTEADVACGRAYVCPHETGSICVRVRDCDCLDEVEDRCELEVTHPPYCELLP